LPRSSPTLVSLLSMAARASGSVSGCTADILYARLAHMEEQLASEQRLRCDTEQRLTKHFDSLMAMVPTPRNHAVDVLRMEGQVSKLQSTMDSMEERLDYLAERCTEFEQQSRQTLENLQEGLSSVESKTDELRVAFDLHAEHGGVNRSLEKLAKDVESLRSSALDESMAQVARHEHYQGKVVEKLEQRVRGIEEALHTKMQTLIGKLDSTLASSLPQPSEKSELDKLSVTTGWLSSTTLTASSLSSMETDTASDKANHLHASVQPSVQVQRRASAQLHASASLESLEAQRQAPAENSFQSLLAENLRLREEKSRMQRESGSQQDSSQVFAPAMKSPLVLSRTVRTQESSELGARSTRARRFSSGSFGTQAIHFR